MPVQRDDLVDQILAEHAALRDPDADPALAALGTAILLEDVFDVELSDDDIDPAVLGDPAAVRSLLRRVKGAG